MFGYTICLLNALLGSGALFQEDEAFMYPSELPKIMNENSVSETPVQKFYLAPSELAFLGREIFAQIGGQWIPVNGVQSDMNGIYVVSNNPYHTRWMCDYCGYNNNGWDRTCQNWMPDGKKCGNTRPW